MASYVEIKNGNGEIVAQGTARTDDPTTAISRVARRNRHQLSGGYSEIGTCQHFPGGYTYHVQFGRSVSTGGMTLGRRYVVSVQPV